MKKVNFKKALFAIVISTVFTASAQKMDAKSEGLINALVSVNGGWQKLASKKDVEYTYVYHDLQKGKDVSLERYIFDGQASWAEYKQHEVNILPTQKGVAKQSALNGEYSVTLNGKSVTDKDAINSAIFFRSVNYYWLTMMYKLKDPGTIYKYLGNETVNGVNYDKVSLTFDAKDTGKEVNDEYVLFFNPKTHLVDRFFFSLPAWGITKPVLIMELKYEVIDDMHIATTRKVLAPNKAGEYGPYGMFTSKDIKFNNGFTKEDFKL